MGNLINHDWSLKEKGIWWIFLFFNGVFWSRLDLNPWHFCIFIKPLLKSAFEFHFSTRILFVKAFFACTCTLWCPLQTIHISLKLRSLFWGHLLSVIGQNFFCDYCVKLWHYFDLIHLQCNTDIKCTYLVKWKSGSMTTLTSKVVFIPLLLHLCKNLIPFFYSGRFTYCMGRIICKLISWKLISQIWAFWLANRENSFDISQSKCSNLGNQFWEIK